MLLLLGLVLVVSSGSPVQPVGSLSVPRAVHTATLLPTGRVLIAGGCAVDGCEPDARGSTTELFNPGTGRFEPGPRLTRARVGHAAVRLGDGSVLVLGGWTGGTPTATAERYWYIGGRFVPTGSMTVRRGGFTATRLPGGRVLVTGGSDGRRVLRSAELYDPRRGRFVRTGPMRTARDAHAAALLPGGRVLVTGGRDRTDLVLRSAEVWSPKTGRFTPAGRMTIRRYKHEAIGLRNGDVLVLGGSNERDFRGRYASAELYDGRRFRRVGSMSERRFKLPGSVVLLPSGTVVVAGGGRTVEAYAPSTRRFRRLGQTGKTLSFATATVLADGRVLVAGGYDDSIAVSRRAWVVSRP